jgi:hypothetical protein
MIVVAKRLFAIAFALGFVLSVAYIALSTETRGSAFVVIGFFAGQGMQFLIAVQAWETLFPKKLKAILLAWLSPLISFLTATVVAIFATLMAAKMNGLQSSDWIFTRTVFGLGFPAILIPVTYLLIWLLQKLANKLGGNLFGHEK